MTDDEVEALLDGAGHRLRALRDARRATLADIALVSGLSTSTLSRLENGLRRPTLGQALRLARAYRVPLDELVAAPSTGDPRVHLRPVRRSGLVVVPLTSRPGGIQAYKVVFPPAGHEPSSKRQAHEGHQWFYVLSGAVRVVLDREESLVVEGEAGDFDARTPHWLGSAGARPAEVLMLFGPLGERAAVVPVGR